MNRRSNSYRTLFGFALALATLATRWPIRAKTFFEFDSINFAAAAIRFDLSEVTPQMPGYILHVLLGRAMLKVTGDLNQAYIWVSILLSIGAVFFLWRAAAQLRGERVAVIAALIWLTTPLFWFHGTVAAIYAEEAFFTSLLLYLGLKWMNHPSVKRGRVPYANDGSGPIVTLYFIAYSLAGAARQTSLLFFFPATLFLLWKCRPSKDVFRIAFIAFLVVTAIWGAMLLHESGSLQIYLFYLQQENNFKTQSIIFGNSFLSQLDTMEKVAFFFPIAMGAMSIGVLAIVLMFRRRTIKLARARLGNVKVQYIIWIALPALIFYFVVFFMKAGYFLNVVPSAVLIAALMFDRLAIWLAEWQKRRSSNKLLLTRPLITRNVIVISGSLVLLNTAWFLIPWPGTSQDRYDNEDTRNSFIHGAVHRYENSGERMMTLANRAFEYTNISGIQAVDSLNSVTQRTLLAAGGNLPGQVIIASWWYRWCYILMPHAATYDVELDPKHAGKLWVGRAQEMRRDNIQDTVIRFQSARPVILLLRHDRPDFEAVSRQVHLQRLPMPEYLDAYQILDTSFTLKWGDRTFVKSN